MAVLTQAVPLSTLEMARDAIAMIIRTEATAQIALQQPVDPWFSDILSRLKVYSEREHAFNDSEFPIINILFLSGDLGNKQRFSGQCTYQYGIEIMCGEKGTSTNRGDELAGRACQKLYKLAYSTLDHPSYIRLGFPVDSKIIQSTQFATIQRSEFSKNNDGLNVMVYRGVFNVVATEFLQSEGGNPVSSVQMGVKIGETDNGFIYETIQ